MSMFCLLNLALYSQDLVRLTDGKSFLVDIEFVNDESIFYQVGKRQITISKDNIAFIEYLEGGVEYIHPETLNIINPDSIAEPVYKKGNKVYIPFSSEEVAQRSGALRLRELVAKSKLWQLADCEEEAHFVMEFVYSDKGRDHANIDIMDRYGNLIYQTPKIYNSDFVPTHKGQELAESLFNTFIVLFANGKKHERDYWDYYGY